MPAPKVQYSVNGSRLCFVGIREVSSKRWGRRGEAEGAESTNPCVRMGAESSPLCSALLHGDVRPQRPVLQCCVCRCSRAGPGARAGERQPGCLQSCALPSGSRSKVMVQAEDRLTVIIQLRGAFITGLVKIILWVWERKRLN